MIKGCFRAMGTGFTSINTVGQLTRRLGRKYVNRIPSTFLIPKQIPPGLKEENPEQENKREENVSCVYWYTQSGRLKEIYEKGFVTPATKG